MAFVTISGMCTRVPSSLEMQAQRLQPATFFILRFWAGARVRLNLEQDQTHVEIFAEMVARKLHFEWPLSTCRN